MIGPRVPLDGGVGLPKYVSLPMELGTPARASGVRPKLGEPLGTQPQTSLSRSSVAMRSFFVLDDKPAAPGRDQSGSGAADGGKLREADGASTAIRPVEQHNNMNPKPVANGLGDFLHAHAYAQVRAGFGGSGRSETARHQSPSAESFLKSV
jgi:hypothetical protein